MKKIAHLTSVHPRGDTRIFLKMCLGLAGEGYDVALVVADGLGNETREGVRIIDVGAARGRRDRMVGATQRVLDAARTLDADIYHLHDPELLFAGMALKRSGKRVIFDAHEDLPQQILSKSYIHPLARRAISSTAGAVQRFACRRLDYVIGATPTIRDKFLAMGIPSVDVNNYPLLGELDASAAWDNKSNEVCYVGGIAATRGIREIVTAIGLSRSDARLVLAGTFAEADVERDVAGMAGWARVEHRGYQSREGVRTVLARAFAGLVTLHPTPAYLDSLPIKMFEYMSAGLPVIASDFPLWSEIVDGNACGVCVDPHDPQAIADAIDALAADPERARTMGENGRVAVRTRYNWDNEQQKLLTVYRNLLAGA